MKKYIAAVSGGPDSMAMLNMFKKNIKAVCHVNYHKREDSNNDENIVRNFCEKNNIEFYLKSVSKNEYKAKENFQSQARHIRYDFFEQVSKDLGIKDLIVAHNRNDFIETALMQSNRKSKSLYYGIKKKTTYKSLNIYRPLLSFFKYDLLNYCIKNNIMYAIDSSNSSDIYERNRLRKELMKWSKFHYLFFLTKIRLYNLKNSFIRKKIHKKYSLWNNDLNFFLKQNKRVKYYIIYRFLHDNNIIDNSNEKIKNIIKFIEKKSNKNFLLKNNYFLLIKNNKIQIKEK